MATWETELTETLLSGPPAATDANGDLVTVYRLNGSIIDWVALGVGVPTVITVSGQRVLVYQTGRVVYDDEGVTSDHPLNGATTPAGSFAFTLWDARGEGLTKTAFLNLQGQTPVTPPTGGVTGYAARWTPAGLSGASWTDDVGGLVLTSIGTVTPTTSPSGATWLNFQSGEGFLKTGGIGTLPIGNSDRTIVLVIRAEPDGTVDAGFSYGGTTAGTAFGAIIGGVSNDIGMDTIGNVAPAYSVNDGFGVVYTAVYEEGTLTQYRGDVLIRTDPGLTLATAGDEIRVMRGTTAVFRQGNIAEIRVYGYPLTQAEVTTLAQSLYVTYLSDIIKPILSVATLNATGATVLDASITMNEAGRLSQVLTNSATQPTIAQIEAGQDHTGAVADGAFGAVLSLPGTVAHTYTGQTGSTNYYTHTVGVDQYNNYSTRLSSALATTPSSSVAPTDFDNSQLTFPSSVTIGTLLRDFSLSVDQPTDTWTLEGTPPSWLDMGATTGRLVTDGTPVVGSYSLDVKALNDAGSVTQTVPATVSAPGGGGVPAAHYSVSWPGAVTLMTSWGATIPGGTGQRIIEINQPYAGNISFQGMNFTNGEVLIRPAPGIFTSGLDVNTVTVLSNPAKLTGNLTISNASGIRFRRIFHQGELIAGTDGSSESGSHGITFDSCALQGTPYAFDTSPTANVGNTYCEPSENRNLSFINCWIGWGDSDAIIQFRSNNWDVLFDGCIPGPTRHDLFKILGTARRFTFRNCWGTPWYNIQDGKHFDWLQVQGSLYDSLFEGCIIIKTFEQNGDASVHQMFYLSGGPSNNPVSGVTVRNNIMSASAGNGITASSNALSVNNTCEDNDLIRVDASPNGDGAAQSAGVTPKIIGAWQNVARNIVTGGTSGTNGVTVSIGNETNYNFPGLAASGYYSTGWPKQIGTTLDWIRPPSAAVRTHWDYAGTTVGAAVRKRQLFVEGLHPGATGWPNAGIFKGRWDTGNVFGISGSFDQYGDNQ